MVVFLVFNSRLADAKDIGKMDLPCNAGLFRAAWKKLEQMLRTHEREWTRKGEGGLGQCPEFGSVRTECVRLSQKQMVLKLDAHIGINTGYILALSKKPRSFARGTICTILAHLQVSSTKLAAAKGNFSPPWNAFGNNRASFVKREGRTRNHCKET